MLTFDDCDTDDRGIFWDNDSTRRVYDDPRMVVFDTRLELRVGFERAYRSYERDVELATERYDKQVAETAKATLVSQAVEASKVTEAVHVVLSGKNVKTCK
jgi:predicted TIM-barrel enzyme